VYQAAKHGGWLVYQTAEHKIVSAFCKVSDEAVGTDPCMNQGDSVVLSDHRFCWCWSLSSSSAAS